MLTLSFINPAPFLLFSHSPKHLKSKFVPISNNKQRGSACEGGGDCFCGSGFQCLCSHLAAEMTNGRKNPPEIGIQMPEAKFAAESTTMSGPLVSGSDHRARRKTDMAHTILRFLCLISALISLCFMASAKQSGNVSIYGLSFPVYSKWSFSDSFEYLLGMSAAVAAHSLLQLLLSMSKLSKKLPVIPSRNHAWLIFAGDQAFAYAMMSAASAASGVTNLNRAGIRHTPLPDFCKPLRHFCDRIAVSIAFAFFSFFLLAISTILDVVWLSKY